MVPSTLYPTVINEVEPTCSGRGVTKSKSASLEVKPNIKYVMSIISIAKVLHIYQCTHDLISRCRNTGSEEYRYANLLNPLPLIPRGTIPTIQQNYYTRYLTPVLM